MSTDDSSFPSNGYAGSAETAEPDLPRDAGGDAGARLDLLLPAELPVEHPLGAEERGHVKLILTALLHALEQPDRAAGLARLEAILARLPAPEGTPARINDTGIPADLDHVADFDRYFRVKRVAANQPALGLVRGLAQTAHAVLALAGQAGPERLAEAQVAQQIVGFTAYTHLLARTFDLGALSSGEPS